MKRAALKDGPVAARGEIASTFPHRRNSLPARFVQHGRDAAGDVLIAEAEQGWNVGQFRADESGVLMTVEDHGLRFVSGDVTDAGANPNVVYSVHLKPPCSRNVDKTTLLLARGSV